jgi:GrpB-like predicted nucleotidyltransferase (UPF0157 family)
VSTNIFEPASKPLVGYREWDPRYPEVVRSLLSRLVLSRADVTLEHVGSTAIAGCGGKGVIDLLALYRDGALEDARTWLLSLGLGRQGAEFARPWSESRPMYLGWYRYAGEQWLVYVHVVVSSSDEVRRFLDFRKLLSGSAELVAAYCQLKRDIVASGITDTDEYAVQKRAFFRSALGTLHTLSRTDS